MHIGPTEILDTYAEAFTARYARLIVTAVDEPWADIAASAAIGYSTSVIGCDCEAGIERKLPADETPDGRSGVSLLLFAFTPEKLADAVANRVGQCVLTCPTTACYDGLPHALQHIPLGDCIRQFGDGYESSFEREGGRYCWRIPVTDGEFQVDDVAGVERGVAGGNLILQADSQATALAAAQRAAGALAELPGVITPFPGGVCRSASKVGSRQGNLIASIADTFCPTLRDEVATQLVDGAACAYELIVDGVDLTVVGQAMRTAIEAAAGPGVLAIGARHFDGKLGKHKIRLWELFERC